MRKGYPRLLLWQWRGIPVLWMSARTEACRILRKDVLHGWGHFIIWSGMWCMVTGSSREWFFATTMQWWGAAETLLFLRIPLIVKGAFLASLYPRRKRTSTIFTDTEEQHIHRGNHYPDLIIARWASCFYDNVGGLQQQLGNVAKAFSPPEGKTKHIGLHLYDLLDLTGRKHRSGSDTTQLWR